MLTAPLKETLFFIHAFSKENKYPPTLQECADFSKVTKGTIQQRLESLIACGLISQEKGKPRTCVIRPSASAIFLELK